MTLEQYLQQKYTKTTVASYLRHISRFQSRVSNFQYQSYQEMLAYFDHFDISTVGLSAIKQYHLFLVEQGIRNDNPIRNIVKRRTSKDVQFQELFLPNELELLLTRENRYKHLNNRNKAILSLLIYQALTPENIINLQTKDVNLEEGLIYIRPTKQTSKRTLELKAKQLSYFIRYSEQDKSILHPKGTYFFYTKTGMKLTIDVIQHLVEVMQLLFADRKLTLTKIRQSVISNWINIDKLPIEDVQLLSGQKWLSTVEKYKRMDRVSQREKINKFFPI